MPETNTTAIVQQYLVEMAGKSPSDPVIRVFLDRAVVRLQRLCAMLLHHDFPRLTRPPLNLQTDEPLGAVVERLLDALRQARPRFVRDFFALAGQHMRWEWNDLARCLDNQPAAFELREGAFPAPHSSGAGLSPAGLHMLEAIDGLPEDERELFDLVRIQSSPTSRPGRSRGCPQDRATSPGPGPSAADRAAGRPRATGLVDRAVLSRSRHRYSNSAMTA